MMVCKQKLKQNASARFFHVHHNLNLACTNPTFWNRPVHRLFTLLSCSTRHWDRLINIKMSTASHSATCCTLKASAIMAFYSQLTEVYKVLTELYCFQMSPTPQMTYRVEGLLH
jgi:hypothetical protein